MDSLLHIASLIFRIEISEIKSSMHILPQALKEMDMLLIEKGHACPLNPPPLFVSSLLVTCLNSRQRKA
jgi:hypothetical protein